MPAGLLQKSGRSRTPQSPPRLEDSMMKYVEIIREGTAMKRFRLGIG